jgi:hypothetical protein
MKSTEATVFDRKSGAAEGPAVRPGSRTKVSVPLVPPLTRHPACPGLPWERSASQIDRVTQRLWRVVEGTSAVLICPCCPELFNHRSPTTRSAVSWVIPLNVDATRTGNRYDVGIFGPAFLAALNADFADPLAPRSWPKTYPSAQLKIQESRL